VNARLVQQENQHSILVQKVSPIVQSANQGNIRTLTHWNCARTVTQANIPLQQGQMIALYVTLVNTQAPLPPIPATPATTARREHIPPHQARHQSTHVSVASQENIPASQEHRSALIVPRVPF
tara:strand:- start:21006 stop:21374 length:369 start_codon:yes stop_codon:yes gene_type:complete